MKDIVAQDAIIDWDEPFDIKMKTVWPIQYSIHFIGLYNLQLSGLTPEARAVYLRHTRILTNLGWYC